MKIVASFSPHISRICLFVAFFSWIVQGVAAPGDLDRTFGPGKVLTDLGANDSKAYSVAVQGDGKILVAGRVRTGGDDDFLLLRYTPTGELDPDFGAGGWVKTDFAGDDDTAFSVALQSDGKIVVAGVAGASGRSDIALARFLPTGELDINFGSGGKVTRNFGGGVYAVGRSVVIQPDKKILVAGDAAGNVVLVRCTEAGMPDGNFGDSGTVTTDFAGGADGGYGLALRSDGRIIVAGEASIDDNRDFMLLGYTAAGALDDTFGSGGKVSTDFGDSSFHRNGARSVIVQSDGSILAAGGVGSQLAVARFTEDGILDPNFGNDGLAQGVTGFYNLNSELTVGMALQANGKIVVTGLASGNFGVARFNADGYPDYDFGRTDFSVGGAASTYLSDSFEASTSVAVQSNGKILVAGYSGERIALVRYTSAGLLDGKFNGQAGRLILDVIGGFEGDYGVASQGDGKILITGQADFLGGVKLSRYTATGELDQSFGSQGHASDSLGNNFGHDVAVLEDGKILVAGQTNQNLMPSQFTLVRHYENGGVDSSFGNNGRVMTTIGTFGAEARKMALLPGGNILLAGHANQNGISAFALARYTSSGELDTTFGNEGTVVTAFDGGGVSFQGLAVQSGEKILVAGELQRTGGHAEFALARYTSAGVLDSGFGTDGKITVAVGNGDAHCRGVAIQNNGRIIWFGNVEDGTASYLLLLGYTAEGQPDMTFGDQGKAIYDGVYGYDLTVQANGGILVTGKDLQATYSELALLRFTSGGELDATFGDDGLVLTKFDRLGDDSGYHVKVQPDGRILVAGSTSRAISSHIALVRYEGDGVVTSDNADLVALDLSAQLLDQGFDPATLEYTARVAYATSTITVGPVAADVAATLETRVNGGGWTPVESGARSEPLALLENGNDIEIKVTAPNGVATKTYKVTVTRAKAQDSTNVQLSALTLSAGSLDSDFSPGTTFYSALFPLQTQFFRVTPTAAESHATIRVRSTYSDYETVPSGSASEEISVQNGFTTLTIEVVAQDGVTKGHYTIFVSRGNPTGGAYLSALALSTGSLTPFFSPTTTGYAAKVSYATAAITVTPTASDAEATVEVQVNGGGWTSVVSGAPSGSLALLEGPNSIQVKVKASGGTPTKIYTITVTRALAQDSTDSLLSALVFSAGTLDPGFSPTAYNYTITMPLGTASFNVTPTASEANATILVDDLIDGLHSVSSGSARSISLQAGVNEVRITVIAQDGVTASHYYIWVMREGANSANLTGLTINVGTLVFVPSQLRYTMYVLSDKTQCQVTPTAVVGTTIRVQINGGGFVAVDSGHSSGPLSLSGVENKVEVEVKNGPATTVYVIVIYRAAAESKSPVVKCGPAGSLDSMGWVTISGTVSENQGLASFTVRLNGVLLVLESPLIFQASTSIPWAVKVQPENGPNILVVEAIDIRGNKTIFQKVLTFVKNRPELAGNFNVILVPGSSGAGSGSVGTVIVTVTNSGTFTGKIVIAGVTKTFSGVLANDGSARFKPNFDLVLILVDGSRPLGSFAFKIDSAGITGTLTGSQSVLAQFFGKVSPYSGKNLVLSELLNLPAGSAKPSKGYYTVAFPSKGQTPIKMPNTYPQGAGYAGLTLKKTGKVTLAGYLADGTKYAATGALRADGKVALFTSLYRKKGQLGGGFGGELTFDLEQNDTDVSGTNWHWVRPIQPGLPTYAAGWQNGISIDPIGTKYAKPASLDFGQGTADLIKGNTVLRLTEGGLQSPQNYPVNVDLLTGKVRGIRVNGASYTFSFNPTTGVFGGSFLQSNNTRSKFSGILLNKGANQGGFGYFLTAPTLGNTGQSGNAFLDPAGPLISPLPAEEGSWRMP